LSKFSSNFQFINSNFIWSSNCCCFCCFWIVFNMWVCECECECESESEREISFHSQIKVWAYYIYKSIHG
jgi:hypothetical protein